MLKRKITFIWLAYNRCCLYVASKSLPLTFVQFLLMEVTIPEFSPFNLCEERTTLPFRCHGYQCNPLKFLRLLSRIRRRKCENSVSSYNADHRTNEMTMTEIVNFENEGSLARINAGAATVAITTKCYLTAGSSERWQYKRESTVVVWWRLRRKSYGCYEYLKSAPTYRSGGL